MEASVQLGKRISRLWLAVEYLQPAPPPKKDAKKLVWKIDEDGVYPWHEGGVNRLLQEKQKPNHQWQHTVHAGLIDMAKAVEELRRHLDVRAVEEEFRPPGPAAMLCFQVDAQGMIASDVSISSVVWAMGRILSEGPEAMDPAAFEAFTQMAREVLGELLVERAVLSPDFAKLNELDPNTVSRYPLRNDDVKAMLDRVAELAGYGPTYIGPAMVRSRQVKNGSADQGTDDDILNSFVAPDLQLVHAALGSNDVGKALRDYLFGTSAPQVDMVRDRAAAYAAVEPRKFPAGRWASDHPLVFAQQGGVNEIFERLKDGGIFSINGPPGTGKTTLLRDVVAAVVVQRAEVLASLATPDQGFGASVAIPGQKWGYQGLNPRLRGFGIVVASANNAAVENVTRELPGASAIGEAFPGVDYFRDVSDSLAATDRVGRAPGTTWGLISAVLGNSERRGDFAKRFWYASAGEGTEIGPQDGISFPMALANLEGTVPDWNDAREEFRRALTRAQMAIGRVATLKDALLSHDGGAAACEVGRTLSARAQAALPTARNKVAATAEALATAQAVAGQEKRLLELLTARHDALAALRQLDGRRPAKEDDQLAQEIAHAKQAVAVAERAYQDVGLAVTAHMAAKPGVLKRLFGSQVRRNWETTLQELIGQRAEAGLKLNMAQKHLLDIEAEHASLRRWVSERASAERKLQEAEAMLHRESVRDRSLEEVAAASVKADRQLEHCATAARQAKSEESRYAADLSKAAAAIRDGEARMADAIRTIESLNSTLEALRGWRMEGASEEDLQRWAPWQDKEMLEARARLFLAALDLHKAFLLHARSKVQKNLGIFVDMLTGKLSPRKLEDGGSVLWDTLFLVIPAISTTFASFGRLFLAMGRESIGWLLVDEAGQATPQLATGAIWRAKRAVIVGDPLQVEPVMTVPKGAVSALAHSLGVDNKWDPSMTSVQILADEANPLGTWIGSGDVDDDERIWVGSPLRVHRRCIEPMFGIANTVAYNGLMVFGNVKDGKDPWLGPSCWIDMPAVRATGHWIEDQGKKALELLEHIARTKGGLLDKEDKAHAYVVSPFRTVSDEMKELIKKRFDWETARKVCGTVHTFQGKEANVVVLLLGGDPAKPGSISSYAGKTPNILNVAVTRAKKRLYVIGDQKHWSRHRYYDVLASRAPRLTPQEFDELPQAAE